MPPQAKLSFTHSESVRLDKWLWAARFFKTRTLAANAVDAGKVWLNGERVKPARILKIGDQIKIRQNQFVYEIDVLLLSTHRGSATEAAKLFAETEQSRQTREALIAQLKAMPKPDIALKGRPTKKARRQIIRFTEVK